MDKKIELEQVAQINSNFESSGRVYSVDGLSPTINTCGGGQREVKISEDFDNMKDLKNEYADEPKILKYTRTEYGKDIRKQYEDGEIYEKRANMVQLEAREDGLCNTLTSVQKDNLLMDNPQDSVLGKPNLKTQMCNQLILEGKVVENDVIRHSYSTKRMNGEMKDIQENNMSPTIDTRADCLGVCVAEQMRIEPQVVGGVGNINWGTQYRQGNRIYDGDKIACALNASPVGNTGGNSYLYKIDDAVALDEQNNYIRKDGCVGALTTDGSSPKHNNRLVEPIETDKKQYRIRKLTPKECGRLMCIKDKDIDNIAKNQSQHSQYHLYGDSICCFPLMAIFGEMFDINWQEKVNSFYDNIKE